MHPGAAVLPVSQRRDGLQKEPHHSLWDGCGTELEVTTSSPVDAVRALSY